MSKRRMAEVLEWETASGRFEGRKPAVQPRDRLWVIKTSSVAENRDARIDRLVVVTARSLGKR
jgi:hypothetical protein